MKFLKSLVLLSLLSTASAYSYHCEQEFHILSDLDDTIKTYRSEKLKDKAEDALYGTAINGGFDVLFKELIKESIEGKLSKCSNNFFTILSASPFFLRKSVNNLLREHKFPRREVILRPNMESTYEYKIRNILYVNSKVRLPLILIGDDTSKDPDAYRDFGKLYPEIVLATYIHNVKNREQIEGQINYLTAFEIAINEYLSERLSKGGAIRVGLEVLKSINSHIIPSYGHCPTKKSDIKGFSSTDSDRLNFLSSRIKTKIVSICRKRRLVSLFK